MKFCTFMYTFRATSTCIYIMQCVWNITSTDKQIAVIQKITTLLFTSHSKSNFDYCSSKLDMGKKKSIYSTTIFPESRIPVEKNKTNTIFASVLYIFVSYIDTFIERHTYIHIVYILQTNQRLCNAIHMLYNTNCKYVCTHILHTSEVTRI